MFSQLLLIYDLSLRSPENLTIALWYHLNGTIGSYSNSTTQCHTPKVKIMSLVPGDQTMVDGVEDEFQTVGNTQLIKYIGQVVLGSVFAYPEFSR